VNSPKGEVALRATEDLNDGSLHDSGRSDGLPPTAVQAEGPK